MMNQPQPTDPCLSIRQDIEETENQIQSDFFDLQHPEDLLPEQEVAIAEDLKTQQKKLKRLQIDLNRCREENPQHRESSQTVPSETG